MKNHEVIAFQKLVELLDVKAWQAKSPEGKQFWYLEGYASDTSVDRDGDRMSKNALADMRKCVEAGMNLFLDHKHELMNTLGVVMKAEERSDRLWVQTRLEDPEINPLVKQLLHKIDIGEKVGLSIGGDMLSHHWEDDPKLGKSVRVIDGVALYEISAVGLPSNQNAFVFGSVFKSFDKKGDHKMTCSACADTHKDVHELIHLVEKAMAQAVPPQMAPAPMPTQRMDMPFAARPEGAMGYQEAGEKPPSDWLDRCVESVAATGTAEEPYAVCTAQWQKMASFMPTLTKAERVLLEGILIKMAKSAISKSKAQA